MSEKGVYHTGADSYCVCWCVPGNMNSRQTCIKHILKRIPRKKWLQWLQHGHLTKILIWPNHAKFIQIYCIYVRWQKPCRQQLTALQNRQRVWVLHHHCEPGTRCAEMGRASHARTRPRRAAHVPRHCVFCRSCTSDFLGADKKYRHRPSTSSGWNSGKS